MALGGATERVGEGVGSPSPSPTRIPKLFHFVWMGSDLPKEYELFIQAWQDLHPDWKVCGWNENNLKQELNGTALKLFEDAEMWVSGHPWQLRSDIARYALLLRYGGVYLDVDTEPLQPIDELCEQAPGGCWFGWEKQDVWVGNTYIGARPGHAFMSYLMQGLGMSVTRHQGTKRANEVSGPRYVTTMLSAYKTTRPSIGAQVSIYNQQYLYPYSFNELHRRHEPFPEAYAIHHWNNRRQRDGVPL